jgi:hypothetical protein
MLGIEIFTVPYGRVKIFPKGKTIENDYRGDGLEHKEIDDPKFCSGTFF